MQELATFSLETDSTVLLHYKNGRKQRVRMAELAKYALSVDIEKIRAAYRLRTSFIDTHMPKASMILMVLLGAGFLGLTAVAGKLAVAELTRKPVNIQPRVSGHEEVARSLAEPSAQPVAFHTPTAEKVNATVRAIHISSSSGPKRRSKPGQADGSSKQDPKLGSAVGSLFTTPPPVAQKIETPVTPATEIVPPTPAPEASPEISPPGNPATDTSRP